jgi:hypothetical protein
MNIKFELVVCELRSILDSIKNIWVIIFDLYVLDYVITVEHMSDSDLIEAEYTLDIDSDLIDTRVV